MLEQLRQDVLAANQRLVTHGLVHGSFGNVSAADRSAGVMVIKPTGVPYDQLTADEMAVVSLGDGSHLGGLKPSSDTPTHLELYRQFKVIGGIVHTHSTWATSFAQAHRPIPCLGTTHADYFRGAIPVTRPLNDEEIAGRYEHETGVVIAERFAELDPLEMPAVLVAGHGVFAWGPDEGEAVRNAAVLEYLAQLAHLTLSLGDSPPMLAAALADRHYFRKHGTTAYYGQ